MVRIETAIAAATISLTKKTEKGWMEIFSSMIVSLGAICNDLINLSSAFLPLTKR